MPSMAFSNRADEMHIDSEKLIENFNDEGMAKRDEEEAQQKRTTFSFGGQSVKDRIKKRKMNSKLGNEVQKLERIIKLKKGVQSDEGEGDDDEGEVEAKRVKQ
ncbi:hypothetical protein FGO68_gene16977 [Halteria grandinella]|uniref:Uncharacterized protein n=1 Tax=Halteria grandinella TaxID=5974 RepID=A0A8J8NLP7_HALGN|nr:hypothetical protein FGO68_gene16977 [Halteria grandinella]